MPASAHKPKSKPAPATQPPRRRGGLTVALTLVTLLTLGFAAWSWHQTTRPGATHLQAGMDAQAAHHDTQAEQEWRQGIQEDPAFADNYAALGDLYLRQRRFPDAAAQYQAAAKLAPRDGTLFLRLTRAQLGAHKPVEALDAAQRAMALRPDDPDAAGVCGMIAARLSNRPAALTALRRAHALRPDDQDYLLELVRQEINAVDMAGAERDLAQLLQTDPNNGEANRLMALLYKQKPPTPENIQAGLGLAQRACREMPDSADAFLLLGQLHLNAGHVPEALKAFQKAQTLQPNAAEILSGLVTCYTRLHDTARAAQAAAALQTLSARQERIEHLKTTLNVSPGDITARLELARREEDAGDVSAAQSNYAKAARQAPNDPRVMAALAALRRRHPPGSPAAVGPKIRP